MEGAEWVGVGTFLVLCGGLVVSCMGIRKIKRQLQQMADSNQVRAMTEHNWELYDHWGDDLPRFLPSWNGLDKVGFGWRVLLLNHLNLLKAAYDDDRGGRAKKDRLDQWIEMSTFWFKDIRNAQESKEDHPGLGTLNQLLSENIYPEAFVECLRRRGVLPSESEAA